MGEVGPVSDPDGLRVVAQLWGANLHPWPERQQPGRGLGPQLWARPHQVCQQATEEDPERGCAWDAGDGEVSPEAGAQGPGVLAKLWGANLHHWPLGW